MAQKIKQIARPINRQNIHGEDGSLEAAKSLPNREFIVATDNGIFHKMHAEAPGKVLIEAPTGGHGATCQSCAHCPWMAMNGLRNLKHVLQTGANEIHIDEDIRKKAVIPIERMLDFAAMIKARVSSGVD